MSRYGQDYALLPQLLKKYQPTQHKAIVETFSEMISDNYNDDDVKDLLLHAKGESKEADAEIEVQLTYWGFEIIT